MARTLLRLAAAPVAFIWGLALIGYVRAVLLVRRRGEKSRLHQDAMTCVDQFAAQYPMHLYPIVAKSLELAYLREALPRVGSAAKAIAEIAIGEGTLSARVFKGDRQVVGVDLNPYSLKKAAVLEHVRTAIIADGLNPPLVRGAFDLLLSNNFLHHVSSKAATIRNWAAVASRLIFNDNTPYWSRSFSRPYLLRRFASKTAAESAAQRIERQLMQHLEARDALVRYANESCDIVEEISFMAARTFFLCATFSSLIGSYGPPTPFAMKWLYNGPLRFLAMPLTRSLARLLIRYDMLQDRRTDTYVTLVCDSRLFRRSSATSELRCPACDHELSRNTCTGCDKTYESRDGMLFLLPPDLAHVFSQYRPEAGNGLPTEHL